MDEIRIDVFDSHDLHDLIGDLDLALHLCCSTIVKSDYDIELDGILTNISKIFTRYTPRTDELVQYIDEFKYLILNRKFEIDVNAMMFLYDCFSHDLRNFIDYATTVGMSKENENIIYKPTYMGIQQLLEQLTQEESTYEGYCTDDIFDF